MPSMDKLFLWGAAALMAAVGSLSAWKTSQTPRIDPEISQLQREYREIWNGPPRHPGPGPVPTGRIGFIEPLPEPQPVPDGADLFRTRAKGSPIPLTPREYSILSVPVIGAARADLDGVTITWTLAEPEATLKPWMIRKTAKPEGFIVERLSVDGKVDPVVRLGPEAKSFTDLSAAPRSTYRYRVFATGNESMLSSYPPMNEPVTKGSTPSAEVRTPAATRVKLVGGDKSNGILRVETYDRAQKKWVGKLVQAAPGRAIGASGWTLKGLRFDNFTLVADLTDDEGVDRVVTTKN